ncbi:ankyrin repeat-containing domain protein [Mycena maculata]|uniref:Ankyrin repeat-containing domain protein n=1 Tax=Mycena maculata TaxID=230809 RepID=A0AAD7MQL2_9AGAR|nr:ankyrin repeat-containing domain protein [Mycena maculata]
MEPTSTANPHHSRLQRVKAGLGKVKQKFTKGALQPSSHSSDSEEPSRAASITDTGVDTLILAADMVEKIANVVNKAPLVGPVAALVSEVFQTVKDVRDMRGNRDTLHTELRDKMKDLSAATSQQSSYDRTTERLTEDLKIYHGLLQDASNLVSDFDAKGRLKTAVQYPAWKRKFDDLEKKLQSFEGRFILNRATDIQTVQAEMRETARIEALRKTLYEWLQSPPDMTSKQDELQRLRHENTGSWFLNGHEFGEWRANPGSLWIRANSGTGKSVLCSTVIREVSTSTDVQPSAIAYFYFDFRDERRQRPDVMLRSIIFQLSSQSTPPYRSLSQLHDKMSSVPPHDEDLLQVLDELLSELGRSYIILDALDECVESDFHRIVEFLKSLLGGSTERPFHLLFTSQPRQLFNEAFNTVTCIELQSGVTGNDIRSFVEKGVSHLKGWAGRAEQVTDQVVDKSNGMFRLAACLLKELDDCWSNEWEETLNNLPSDLYAIYARFLERVPSKRLVYIQIIFRWILYSARPIGLHELADAMSFNFSDPAHFIYEPHRREDNTLAIFKWLDGLIVIKEHDYYSRHWPEKSVALAHASVQDYILSKQFTDKFAMGHDFTESPSQTFLAQSCVSYLLYFSGTEHPLNAETFPNYPLSMYAAKYWFHHLQLCDNPDTLLDLTMHLLEDGSSQYTALNHLHDIIEDDKDPDWNRSIPSPLDVCSTIGYTEGVHFFLESGADVNSVGSRWGTPLQTAASEGFTEIVDMLLNKGAILYPTGSEWISPLRMACTDNHMDIVRILLEHGAIASAPDGEVCAALERAAEQGHTEVIQVLLEHGGEIARTLGTTGDVLGFAAHILNIEAVRVFLKNGVPANTKSKRFGSALHAAVGPRPEYGATNHQTEIINLLLDNGANINAVGGKYGGVLQAASAGGMLEIIQLLVDKGLDVNHITGRKYSPLQAASEAGHLEVVRFLLESGAEVNKQGGKFGGALQAAAAALPKFVDPEGIPEFIESQTEIISLLWASGADPNSTGGKFGSTLCAASSGGHHEIVTILLNHGADVNMECGVFGSALQAAAGPLRPKWMQTTKDGEYGFRHRAELLVRKTKTIRVLLDKGAKVDAKFGQRGTALQITSRWGHADIVQVLLENGADLDAGDADHGTALQTASRWGHADIVWILLEKGANVDSNFGKCGTAFQIASRWGHEDIVEMLREHGVHSELDADEVPSLAGFWE